MVQLVGVANKTQVLPGSMSNLHAPSHTRVFAHAPHGCLYREMSIFFYKFSSRKYLVGGSKL